MNEARLKRWMPFEPRQLFPIISRVEDYREFVPLCSHSRVWDRTVGADAIERFRAELTIVYSKLAIRETFTSSVTSDSAKLIVAANSHDYPFKHLNCSWVLRSARGGTEIEMTLDYAMASRGLQLLLSVLFDYAMRKIMTAFEQRAHHMLAPVPLS